MVTVLKLLSRLILDIVVEQTAADAVEATRFSEVVEVSLIFSNIHNRKIIKKHPNTNSPATVKNSIIENLNFKEQKKTILSK